PKDKYAIASDPALAGLKQILEPMATDDTASNEAFARNFFEGTRLYAPSAHPPLVQPNQFMPTVADPFSSWESASDLAIWWKTEDVAARVPSFDAAKARVEAAWRLQQNRAVARKEAEKLREEGAKTGGDYPQLLQLVAQLNAQRQG